MNCSCMPVTYTHEYIHAYTHRQSALLSEEECVNERVVTSRVSEIALETNPSSVLFFYLN